MRQNRDCHPTGVHDGNCRRSGMLVWAMGTLRAIFHQRCPRCREGPIYSGSLPRGWLAMYERCPVCGLKYHREQGYFIGAMYVSYALAIPPFLIMVTGLWLGAGWRYDRALLGTFLAYL